MSDYRRRTLLLLLGLTGLAFALRVVQLDGQSLWRDEVDALRFATQPLPALLTMFRRPAENGPLFFLGLRPWLAVAGHSEFAVSYTHLRAHETRHDLVCRLLLEKKKKKKK